MTLLCAPQPLVARARHSGETNTHRAREKLRKIERHGARRSRRIQNLGAYFRPQLRTARWKLISMMLDEGRELTIRSALRALGVSRSALTAWRRDVEWLRCYDIARELRAEMLLDKAMSVLESVQNHPSLSMPLVKLTKARSDYYCWLAVKTFPERYASRNRMVARARTK